MGIIKLGAVVFGAAAFGGRVGLGALALVSQNPSDDVRTGAIWAGRVTTFLVLAYVASKI